MKQARGSIQRLLIIGTIGGLAVAAMAGIGWPAASTQGQAATVRLVAPPSWSVDLGNFEVRVEIEGVQNLASYEWELWFDPELIEFVSVENGPFLGSTGRSVGCVGPLEYERSVNFGCGSHGWYELPGPSGSGRLSTVVFSPKKAGDAALGFKKAELGDPDGVDIPVTVAGACIAIAEPGGTRPSCPAPTLGPPPTATPLPPGSATPTPPLVLETPTEVPSGEATTVPTQVPSGEPTTPPTPTLTPTTPLPTLTPVPPDKEPVDLVAGCNPVASTYRDGTPIQTIAGEVGREGNLISIWQLGADGWRGYSALYPEHSELIDVNFLDVMFICVNNSGDFVRPLV